MACPSIQFKSLVIKQLKQFELGLIKYIPIKTIIIKTTLEIEQDCKHSQF